MERFGGQLRRASPMGEVPRQSVAESQDSGTGSELGENWCHKRCFCDNAACSGPKPPRRQRLRTLNNGTAADIGAGPLVRIRAPPPLRSELPKRPRSRTSRCHEAPPRDASKGNLQEPSCSRPLRPAMRSSAVSAEFPEHRPSRGPPASQASRPSARRSAPSRTTERLAARSAWRPRGPCRPPSGRAAAGPPIGPATSCVGVCLRGVLLPKIETDGVNLSQPQRSRLSFPPARSSGASQVPPNHASHTSPTRPDYPTAALNNRHKFRSPRNARSLLNRCSWTSAILALGAPGALLILPSPLSKRINATAMAGGVRVRRPQLYAAHWGLWPDVLRRGDRGELKLQ